MSIALILIAAILATVVWLWNSPNQRRRLLTRPLYEAFKRALPSMSETERAALEAGTVWIEADIFKGRPDFHRLAQLAAPKLSPEEESFLFEIGFIDPIVLQSSKQRASVDSCLFGTISYCPLIVAEHGSQVGPLDLLNHWP